MRNTFNSYISEEIHTKFIEQFEFGKKLFYEIEKLDFVKDLKKFELKYFLKSEKSIIDSIKRRSWNLLKQYNEFDEFEFNEAVNQVINPYISKINDYFRITYVSDYDNFQTNIINVLKEIIKIDGINSEFEIDDSFDKDGYKDLKFKTKYNNVGFEIQFHTIETYSIAENVHHIYEVIRQDKNSENGKLLAIDIENLFNCVKKPIYNLELIKEEIRNV